MDIVYNLVKETFSLECIGIRAGEKLHSKEDIHAEDKITQLTRRVGERWETGLFWKAKEVSLQSSYQMALRRLLGVERKLNKDTNLKKENTEKINHYTKSGYARKLTVDELARPTKKQWFLPHFPTTHKSKPEKIRMVFDAASKAGRSSLNDHLMTDSDLLVSLPGVLFKFRHRKIAFTGDMTEMFHQVKIRKEDRAAQRCLWREKENEEPQVY